MREFITLSFYIVIIALTASIVVYLFGMSFDLSYKQSLYGSVVFLFFGAPAVGNIHIYFSRKATEDDFEKRMGLLTVLGQLIFGFLFMSLLIIGKQSASFYIILGITGLCFWWIPVALSDAHKIKKRDTSEDEASKQKKADEKKRKKGTMQNYISDRNKMELERLEKKREDM